MPVFFNKNQQSSINLKLFALLRLQHWQTQITLQQKKIEESFSAGFVNTLSYFSTLNSTQRANIFLTAEKSFVTQTPVAQIVSEKEQKKTGTSKKNSKQSQQTQ
jgi:hypothetical protein